MEVLILILLIVFLSVNSKNNKKKKAQNSAAVKAAAARTVKAKPARAKAQAAAPKNVKPVRVGGQSSPVFMAAPKGTPFRASILDEALADEEGCVGGSMEHTHEEGESREVHKRHTEAAKRREAEELLARAQAENADSERLERMRQAVVMAEILGKPKALQKKV